MPAHRRESPGPSDPVRGALLRRVGAALLAVLFVIFAGGDAWAWPPNASGYSITGHTLGVQDPGNSVTLTAPARPTISGANQQLGFLVECVQGATTSWQWGAGWNVAYYNTTTNNVDLPGCSTGYTAESIRIVNRTQQATAIAGSLAPDDAWTYWGDPEGGVDSDTKVCSRGVLSVFTVADASGDLTYAFRWTGPASKVQYFRIHETGNQANAFTIGTYHEAVGTAFPYYYKDSGEPASPAWIDPGDSVRLRLFTSGGAATDCYVSTVVGSTAVDPFETGTDPEDSDASCGLNPFCYTKAALSWAFVPESDSLDQWSALGSEIEGKVPFSYVTGAVDATGWIIPSCSMPCTEMGSYTGLMTFPAFGESGDLFSTDDPVTVLGPTDMVTEWLRDNRTWIAGLMWVLFLFPFAVWIWKRLFPVVGSGTQ